MGMENFKDVSMTFRLVESMCKKPFRGAGRGPLGIDIDGSAVKLLRWPGKAGLPPEYATRRLPGDAVTEDRIIRDAEAVGRCIAAAAGSLRAPGKLAVTAVPSSAVMQRTLAMEPEMTDAEVEAQIMVEADRYIPWPIDEVRIDFRRLEDPDHPAGTIQLSVCRREHVDLRERAIECAGLRAAGVDVEHHAIERVWPLLLPKHPAGEPGAVAEVGDGAISLHVLQDGRSLYSGEKLFGKRAQDEHDQDAWAAEAARALGQALQLFHSSSRHGRVESLYIGGAAAAADGLREQAQNFLAMPVHLANPFTGARGDRTAKDAPSLLLAAGLAIAGDRHG